MPTRGVCTLTDAEMVEFIQKSKAGILCLVDANKPYAVPLEHVYRDGALYFAVSAKEDSRKLKALTENSQACYVIYESLREKPQMIKEGRKCRSLILEGTVTPTAVKEVDVAKAIRDLDHRNSYALEEGMKLTADWMREIYHFH